MLVFLLKTTFLLPLSIYLASNEVDLAVHQNLSCMSMTEKFEDTTRVKKSRQIEEGQTIQWPKWDISLFICEKYLIP